MLVHDGHRIGKNLCRGLTVAIFVRGKLVLVIAQLIQQTIAQVAAGDSGGSICRTRSRASCRSSRLKVG